MEKETLSTIIDWLLRQHEDQSNVDDHEAHVPETKNARVFTTKQNTEKMMPLLDSMKHLQPLAELLVSYPHPKAMIR